MRKSNNKRILDFLRQRLEMGNKKFKREMPIGNYNGVRETKEEIIDSLAYMISDLLDLEDREEAMRLSNEDVITNKKLLEHGIALAKAMGDKDLVQKGQQFLDRFNVSANTSEMVATEVASQESVEKEAQEAYDLVPDYDRVGEVYGPPSCKDNK
tara:strand:- start:7439 stop:7903 length:465 start_codon:yes stop_codon:yes gene_type:complete